MLWSSEEIPKFQRIIPSPLVSFQKSKVQKKQIQKMTLSLIIRDKLQVNISIQHVP